MNPETRRGPAQGYMFPAKEMYRSWIWNAFARRLKGALADKHLALMPSIEGAEIAVALKKGARVSHLHVIDSSPAIVATLQRKYPGINTYGCSVAAAFERMARRGVILDAANLDFTSCVSQSRLSEIRRATESRVLRQDGAMLAMTALRGREQPAFVGEFFRDWENKKETQWLLEHFNSLRVGGTQELTTFDLARIALSLEPLRLCIDHFVAIERMGIYLSPSRQTMLWFVVSVIDRREMQRWTASLCAFPSRERAGLSDHMAFVQSSIGLRADYLHAISTGSEAPIAFAPGTMIGALGAE